MNWTTTKVPMWQIDCENFRKVGRPFELREVVTDEHHRFLKEFCAFNELQFTLSGTTATISQ